MNFIIIVFSFFIFVFSIDTQAKEYSVETYPYPIVSAELATISSAIPYTRKYDFQKIKLNLYPERDRVYLMEGRNELNIYYLKNKVQSPLAFVFSGVGGTGVGPVAESLMEQIYEAGYSVVSLPNPISWLFVLGVSKSGIPGELSADVSDLYSLMKQVSVELANNGVLSRSFILLGYSQGAAILPKIDQYDKAQRNPFNFDKVILLNPPFDFKKGIQTLDNYFEQASGWSQNYKEATMGYLYSFAERLMKVNSNPVQLLGQFNLTKKQQEFIIGQNYRDTLADILFTQEVLLGKKFLQSPLSWGERSARYSEAKSFTFERYIENILLPYLKGKNAPEQDLDSVYAQYNFENFKDQIVSSGKYYLFHNKNDFLLEAKDLEDYDHLFPETKRFIYPLGGHCGNYNFPINKMDLRSVLENK